MEAEVLASLPALKPGDTRLLLCRHGQTQWNVDSRIQGGGADIELDETGVTQAEALAVALKNCPIDIVASSTLKRAAAVNRVV